MGENDNQSPKIQQDTLEEKQVSFQVDKIATAHNDNSQESNPPEAEQQTAVLEKETLSTVSEFEPCTQENMQPREIEEIWHSVSPNRATRQNGKPARDEVGFEVSPSRFSILEEENEVHSEGLQGDSDRGTAATDQTTMLEDDVEEGEIEIPPATTSSSSERKIDNTRIMEEIYVRASLPRVSKARLNQNQVLRYLRIEIQVPGKNVLPRKNLNVGVLLERSWF